MARPLAPEILRVITSPYTVSLINLDASLRAVGPYEIQAWAESHPCQITALAKETVNSLEDCPYALPVIERLGVAAQLKDEMLLQKPALLDTLIRSALYDDLNFDRFSPALVALLSTPLPPTFPPPAKLVAFFLKCLDRATQAPSIDTIRPLYVLVANGYSHLALQMSENQNFHFAKLMAGLLVDKGNASVNWFLVYCLATLGHMHLACDAKVRLWAVRELFRGKKGASVLGLIINIVCVLASPDNQVDWREKVQVVRMATVAANAVSNTVKSTSASNSNAATLKRILEKTMALDDDRVASEMLQFVSALSLMTPQAPLDATIHQLVKKNRKEETSCMFLPLISIEFFAQAVHADLIGDMLRSVLKCASRSNEATSPPILFLRDRIEFVQQLNKAVPDSPKLQQSVLEALSVDSIRVLVDEFAQYDVHEPTAGACVDGEPCQWAIADLINQLQKALCSFLLRCAIYSQAVRASTIPPSLPNSLMEKLTRIYAAGHKCPFENELKTKASSHDLLSMVETSASPEARIPSHNWRQSLTDGLKREAGRHHRNIVSAVGKICRDLESRSETIDEPLRAEQENSRRLQNELDEWKMKCADAEERMTCILHDFSVTTKENAKLEAELGGAISKNKETMSRVEQLETNLAREREASGIAIEELEQVIEQAKSGHLKQLRKAEGTAERAAMEHMAVLNERQEMIDRLRDHKAEIEQNIADAEEKLQALAVEKGHLERAVGSLQTLVSELRSDAHKSEGMIRGFQEELQWKSAQVKRLTAECNTLRASNDQWKENGLSLAGKLEAVEKDVHQKQAVLVQNLQVIERQNGKIDEFVHEKGLWEQYREACENTEGELRGTVERIRLEMEAANQDHVRKAAELDKELNTKHAQQIAKIKNDHANELDEMTLNNEAKVNDLKDKLSLLREEHEQENRSQQEEIAILKQKLREFRVIYESREKEAQYIGRQLLGLMSSAKPDLTGLFNDDKASLDALSDPSSAQKVTAAARRRPSDNENDHCDDGHPKRAKTTHSSSPPTFQQNSPLQSKPYRNKIATQFEPDAAGEPPVSRTETDYGTAPIPTSIPNNDELSLLNNMHDMQRQTSLLRGAIARVSDTSNDDLGDNMDEEDVILETAAGALQDGTTNQ